MSNELENYKNALLQMVALFEIVQPKRMKEE